MIPALPTIAVSASSGIEMMAQALAATEPAEIDRVVAYHVAAAVRDRRIEDAVRWQRVRLRARGIRLRQVGPFAIGALDGS